MLQISTARDHVLKLYCCSISGPHAGGNRGWLLLPAMQVTNAHVLRPPPAASNKVELESDLPVGRPAVIEFELPKVSEESDCLLWIRSCMQKSWICSVLHLSHRLAYRVLCGGPKGSSAWIRTHSSSPGVLHPADALSAFSEVLLYAGPSGSS